MKKVFSILVKWGKKKQQQKDNNKDDQGWEDRNGLTKDFKTMNYTVAS